MIWPGDLDWRFPWLRLVALAAVPVWLLARRAGGRVRFSALGVLPPHDRGVLVRLAWLPDVALALAAGLLGLALAGPRTPDRETHIRREGIAIAMVVDVSGSMAALDLSDERHQLSRLDAVKAVFRDFVAGGGGLPGRPDDAIGLVSFARHADTRAPLTLDHQMLLSIAKDLQIVSDRNEDGTAVGDGLGLAVEHLRDSKARSRVAILLTDGVNNAGTDTPLAAAELARTTGIKVYTIGAGTNGFAPMPVEDPFTGQVVLRGVPVQIDEDTLKAIADKTGGRYFRAGDGAALRRIYGEIDRLERTKLDETRSGEYDPHYAPLLAIGLLLASLAWIGRGTLFRRLP